ncbi:TRAP transporter small permease subunit [Candidatus Thioglobus sp.]|jgi:TRAP-type mannitol/chloroaromatic compound transport system permease small subunit|uniref:TRAP transporter small permease subunit n=1 Tax=Candidatus Thioglobus sp. TaxID=2026721 RepID=UPI0025BD9EF4|nr:TRAP transporter small permease subunit [Candidatus Thioglobus sp.]
MQEKMQNNYARIPIVSFLNKIVTKVAETTAWLNVALILIILTQVTLRYGFHNGLVALEELIWHLYAVAFMFGISYAITTDSHIRVDIIHANMSIKSQRIVEILGILLLLMPFIVIILDHSLGWVSESYRVLESSSNPTGLSYRWIIKSIIPISLVLMFIAALAKLIEESIFLISHNNIRNHTPGRVSMIKHLFSPQFQNNNQEKN